MAAAARAADAGRLHELRAARRTQVREAVRAKAGGEAAPFGLLVVPVDFADRRLPAGWQPGAALGPRLTGGGPGSLDHYFRVASRGRTSLQIVLAPLVRLTGSRADYSDIGWNGATRTRALAAEALAGARLAGVPFAAADPGGDGEVDGVLILHAGRGLENDPDGGLIVPLQFFLEEAVVQGGVAAQLYAVASQQGPPGMWAHETGHLLGLEDRYDPLLPASGEARARGGLGSFSLMAVGLWGSGDGQDPALPDAYSRSQLGWLDLAPLTGDGSTVATLHSVDAGGTAAAIWPAGEVGRGEAAGFFVLEVRGDPATAPYDGALPRQQLVITHVDESLPEGAASSNQWPDRHLRVRLVEADGDSLVARGLEDGDAADVYPGSTGNPRLAPDSDPPSRDYAGLARFAVTDIGTVPGGVALRVDTRVWPQVAVALDFPAGPPYDAQLRVRELGRPLAGLSGLLAPAPGTAPLGRFEDGGSLTFVETAAGVWEPLNPPRWLPEEPLPPEAVTTFRLELAWPADPGEPAGTTATLRWVWQAREDPLDFRDGWGDGWDVLWPGTDERTAWFRWTDAAALGVGDRPVLAAVGTDFATGAAWPEVRYENDADAVLAMPWLAAGETAVRIVHHVEVETLRRGVAVDGAVLEWERGDGTVVAGVPVGGYPGAVTPRAGHALSGRAAWAVADSLLADGRPQWRVDVVPVPAAPGPWRPRLRLAANPLFRARGWFVADLQSVDVPLAEYPVPATWLQRTGGQDWLVWRYDAPAAWQRVEASLDAGRTWQEAWSGRYLGMLPDSSVQLGELAIQGPAAGTVLLRVVLTTDLGEVALRPVNWQRPTLALAGALGAPHPNPAPGPVRVVADPAGDPRARLAVHDLRGRQLRSWDLGGARSVVVWDGTDAAGRRAASGAYILRLTAHGTTHTRKVTLLR